MPRKLAVTLTATLTAALALLAAAAVAAPANPEAGLGALSCATAKNCTSVTGFQDAIGYGEGLFVTDTNGHWGRAVLAKLPKNAAANPMPELGDTPFLGAELSLLPQTSYIQLGVNAVDCSSPERCTAIGNYRESGNHAHGVFFTKADGRWQRGVEAQLPKNAYTGHIPGGTVYLTALDCSSAGNCTAVGSYMTKRGVVAPVAFAQRRGRWSRGVALTLPKAAGSVFLSELEAIDCPAAGRCVAVGEALGGAGHLVALIATQTARHWTVTVPQLPADSTGKTPPFETPSLFTGSLLNTVSCPAAGQCTVVGSYTDQRYQLQPLVISQTLGGWAPGVELTLPATAATDAGEQDSVIAAIDCPSAGNCSATGTFIDANKNQQGLLFSESSGTWSTGVAAALPAPFATKISSQTAALSGLSCVNAGNCVASGEYSYGDAARTATGLVITETDGVWGSGSTVPLPAGHAHLQENDAIAVACLPGTASGPAVDGADCTLVGGYTDTHANWQGFTDHGVGGVWAPARELRLPGVTRAELSDSLLSALRPHGQAAAIKAIRRHRGYGYSFTAAERGKLTVSWRIRSHGHRVVIAKLDKRVTTAGVHKCKIRLTRAGVKALAAVRKLRATAEASFTTAKGVRVSRSKDFKLRFADRHGGGLLSVFGL